MASILDGITSSNVKKPDYMLGKGLMMPFAASNSGSRKLMFGTQLEHRLPLMNPEVAYIQTGYEMEFGLKSSSYITADEDMDVLGKIPKFSWIPDHHYYMITFGRKTGLLHVYERKEYVHITENYGYLFDNTKIDKLDSESHIRKSEMIQKSTSFDEFDNRMDGCNMLTMYNACEETMEDAIVISESAAKRLTSPLVKKVSIVVNDNDIPLNIYGDMTNYKIFPDIGEESVNSILCGFRREKKEESLYSQSYNRLRELNISDERYTVSGRVVDINVYCNAPDKLGECDCNSQIRKYYEERLRMSKELVEFVDYYIDQGYKMDYDLQVLYSNCKGCIQGKQYFSERVFSNIVLEIVLVEEIPVLRGDKLSNRYGGKGITARVKPDAMMPKTLNGDTVEVILNMCGVYGRENPGQLFEITVSYICLKIVEYLSMEVLDVADAIDVYLTLLKIVAPSMHDEMAKKLSTLSDEECAEFISSIAYSGERSIYLVIEPMSENMTIDKVSELYKAFPWIEPERMLMPIVNSNNEIEYVYSRRPMIYGYQYIYRLKQYAEEKFSVTSLSATNIRNENSKSKSSNNYKALYSRTPIRFGDMETGNLIHLGAELIVQMLMLYSSSPHARRLTSELLTGDAFNIDIKLDMDSTNRNAEILNVYLKTMGLKLIFTRTPKKKDQPILINPIYMVGDYKNPGIIEFNENEKKDLENEVKRLIEGKNAPKWGILTDPIEYEMNMTE